MIKPTEKIWHNGRFIDWNDAKIHVLSHVTSYGSSVFEGVRCYATTSGPAIFRAARACAAPASIPPRSIAWTFRTRSTSCADAMAELVRVNQMDSCYLRPLVLRGYGDVGVMPTKDNPIEVYIACWEWGKYLGEEALGQGRRRVRFQLDAHRAQHPARARQGRRELHELAVDPHGSRDQRLRRRHRARYRRVTSAKARAKICSWCATARSSRRRWARPCCPESRATP